MSNIHKNINKHNIISGRWSVSRNKNSIYYRIDDNSGGIVTDSANILATQSAHYINSSSIYGSFFSSVKKTLFGDLGEIKK